MTHRCHLISFHTNHGTQNVCDERTYLQAKTQLPKMHFTVKLQTNLAYKDLQFGTYDAK